MAMNSKIANVGEMNNLDSQWSDSQLKRGRTRPVVFIEHPFPKNFQNTF